MGTHTFSSEHFVIGHLDHPLKVQIWVEGSCETQDRVWKFSFGYKGMENLTWRHFVAFTPQMGDAALSGPV